MEEPNDNEATDEAWQEPDHVALERLVSTTRDVIQQVRCSAAPSNVMGEATAALEKVRALLAPHAWGGPYAQSCLRMRDPMEFEGTQPEELFPYSPSSGPRNPIAPPVEMLERDGAVHGSVNFGAAYAGPPGFVHGGVIALVFDELLGVATVLDGTGGMTGTLKIRYRAPTPLETHLSLTGRVTGHEGRKIIARGELRCGDVVTAEAEGIFVRLKEPLQGRAPQPR